MREILEKGAITLPEKDLLKYKTDSKSLIKDMGNIVMRDITVPSDTGYYIVFHDSLKEYILGEEEQDCFFNMYYDKYQNLSFFTKPVDKPSITKNVKYVVIKA